MSAGSFVRSRYLATYKFEEIHPIRVQPETIAMFLSGTPGTTNAPPSGEITNDISAQVSRSGRGIGLKPRSITIELTGAAPAGYLAGSKVTLPVLTESFYASVPKGSTVTYLGTTWEVVAKNPERAN